MSQIMIGLNFLGVCLLAGLCTWQWDTNSHLDTQTRTLEDTRESQAAKIVDLDKTIKGNAADMQDLHAQLTKSEDTVKDDEKKLAAADVDKKRMQALVDQDKTVVAQWREAINVRDQKLHELFDNLEKLNAEHSDLVKRYNDLFAKYNDLANKYNNVVNDLNNRAKAGHG